MKTLRARSISLAVLPILDGPEREGLALGHGYVDLGDEVIVLTPLGAPRMPNGIETEVALARGVRCTIGGGRLVTRDTSVLEGPHWDPVPRPRVRLWTKGATAPDPRALAGRGEGLTPAGDDVLAGYAAGLLLFHGRSREAQAIAEEAAPLTTALSATLLRHAARGALPEPAHALLEDGDARPLLSFGHTSGRALLFGLALGAAARAADDAS